MKSPHIQCNDEMFWRISRFNKVLQDRASEREWTWVWSSHHEHGEDSLQRGEPSVCHHVLKIYILKVISINKFNPIFEIIMAIFQEADVYECRTRIDEGGVKKTIVVSLKRITLPAELNSNINNTRNLNIS